MQSILGSDYFQQRHTALNNLSPLQPWQISPEAAHPALCKPMGSVLYAFCTELHRHHGVSDATWQQAIALWGEQGVVDLIGVNGYYTFLSMLMNSARTSVPPSSASPLPPLVG